jgi:hypothetical protein
MIRHNSRRAALRVTRERTTSATNSSTNADGTVDIYFGPKAPAGKEANWIATVPGKSLLWVASEFYG